MQLAAAHWDRLVAEEVQREVEGEGDEVQPFLDKITVAEVARILQSPNRVQTNTLYALQKKGHVMVNRIYKYYLRND